MSSAHRLAATGLVAAGVIAGFAQAAPAYAVPFNSSFTYGGGTDQNYTPNGGSTLLSNATSVTQGTNQVILALKGNAGAVGDLLSYSLTALAIPSAESGTMGAITIDWGGQYSFTSLSGTYARDAVNDDLNFKWRGTFADSSGILSTQGAQFTETWSQASFGILPDVGGTFNTNPSIKVPEPATLALLGTSLLGLGLIARRRTAPGATGYNRA